MRRDRISISTLAALSGLALGQDLNGNGTRDSYEIRSGAATDCNRNGVPDDADLRIPFFPMAIEHTMEGGGVSANCQSVAAIDYDLDGDLDVASLSPAAGGGTAITFWRHDGGTGLAFGTRITVPSSGGINLASGDLNGDGRADIAYADGTNSSVRVLLATGPGTFAPATSFAAGGSPFTIAMGDLDGDGDLDVVTTISSLNSVSVLRNNGNGTFAARVLYPVEFQPVGIAIGDLTGDGLAEIAAANSYISAGPPLRTGTVSVLRGTGGGAFTPHATLSIPGHAETSSWARPRDVAIGDVDGDGDADLVVAAKESNSVTVWTNSGGTLTLGQTIGPFPAISSVIERVLLANLDDDAPLELGVLDSGARAAWVYDNASGVFEHHKSFAVAAEGPVFAIAADTTGDAIREIITADFQNSSFSVLRGRGGLEYDAALHFRRPDSGFFPFLADFTGDGIDDLASYATFDNPATFRYYPGLGNGLYGELVTTPMSATGQVLPRDLDHDGDLDLISVGGHLFSRLNNGDGTFGPEIDSAIGVFNSAITEDVNADGHHDLLWMFAVNSSVESWIRIALGNGDGTFQPYYEVHTPRFAGGPRAGDLDGDGYPEIFLGLSASAFGDPALEKFIVYPNLGDGTFGAYTVHEAELHPNFSSSTGNFAWADIDGDGDGDLLGVAGQTFIWRNSGGVLEPAAPTGGFSNYGSDRFGPMVRDLDGDGDLDFLGIRSVASQTHPALYFNDGTGSFSPGAAVRRYRGSFDALTLGHVNQDGRLDVLSKAQGFADWYMHLNLAPMTGDCNDNGVDDACDIASGTSTDADHNGVPDECDLCPGDLSGTSDPNDPAYGIPDGTVDSSDFFYFLDQFTSGNTAVADLTGSSDPNDPAYGTPDGLIDAADFFFYLDLFVQGC